MANVTQEDRDAVFAFCADTNKEWAEISKAHPGLPASALHFAAELREANELNASAERECADMRLRAVNAETELREARAALEETRKALAGLVKINEDWNASVEKIIGRAPNWSDDYLDAARAALKEAPHA